MKEKFIKFIKKFYKFMEVENFNPKSSKDRDIIQRRVDMMMSSEIMKDWLNKNSWFGQNEVLTNEVLVYLIDCATEHYNEKDFIEKVNPLSNIWLTKLEEKLSKKAVKH